jgi:deoxyadenosine/deoxycytidine kinase
MKDGTFDSKSEEALKITLALQEQILESYQDIQRKYKKNKTLNKSLKIIFLESCAATSMGSFGSLLVDKLQLLVNDFNRLLSNVEKEELVLSGAVYLTTEKITTQMDRINHRGRDGESSITEEYLNPLNEKYMIFYKNSSIFGTYVNSMLVNTENLTPLKVVESIFKHFNIIEHWKSNKQNISIEGCLGTGKSSLGHHLNTNSTLPMRFYEQRLTKNIMEKLEEKYNNPNEKSVFNLQNAFISEYSKTYIDSESTNELRNSIIKELTDEFPSPIINIFEAVFSISNVFTKHHYELGEISQSQYKKLNQRETQELQEMKESIKTVFHLRGTISEIKSRVEKRDRECERAIEEKFIRSISNKYDTLINKLELLGMTINGHYRPLINVFTVDIGPDVTLEYLTNLVDKKYKQTYFYN